MRLTAAMLKEHHACAEQVVIFAAEWPAGCEVTEETLLRARELRLNLWWFACEFLPAPFRAEYMRQMALLRVEFERQETLLLSSLFAQAERW